ncbi:MAG: heavy-metal-associated domain-containing protein [Ignavibacteriae bacterium]|nr:heavy-metal-associated domain-containing protein [Ignavibacteriota bacterium]MCB0752161.1 heavy-metal-associated domain-containing protein [Ignavibacteriota bacterium]MCB9208504.1 heavy-metal-associated domain-containing protein [Ignavibacteriales bacterium]MCB9258387.1 heavy-metal-associated domain-containing protein [Ignavibacteriales bacterium]
MKQAKFNIEGMSCMHCVKAVEVELEELGVESYDVKVGSAEINYDDSKITEQELVKAIDEAGYKVV